MKVIIAGGRDIRPTYQEINEYITASGFDITEIVNGGATGADSAGRAWAQTVGMPYRTFPADWNAHGRKAGPIRNKEMAEYADALILIWDGESRGSASMKREAERVGLPIHEVILSREKP